MRGFAPVKNDFLFERRLNDHLPSIIQEHSNGRPALVFCASRKGASDAAAHLAAAAGRGGYVRDSEAGAALAAAAATARSKPLAAALAAGVGFHHAAMARASALPPDRSFARSLARRCPPPCLAAALSPPNGSLSQP